MRKSNIELTVKSIYFKNKNGQIEYSLNPENGFDIVQWFERIPNPECWHGGYIKNGKYIPKRQEKNIPEDELPKEYCVTIAFINPDLNKGSPNIELIADRLLNLDNKSKIIALDFLREGYDKLQEIMDK
jgi:hypothetical protein